MTEPSETRRDDPSSLRCGVDKPGTACVCLNRDLFGGPVMIAVGLAFAYYGQDYRLGTMRQMGPGFMPTALGVILAVLGLLILVGGLRAALAGGADREPVPLPDWRGLVAIVIAIVSFILLSERAGLAMSTFAVVFISALGDRSNRLRDGLLLAASMTVVGVALFYYGLQIRLPLGPDYLAW